MDWSTAQHVAKATLTISMTACGARAGAYISKLAGKPTDRRVMPVHFSTWSVVEIMQASARRVRSS